MNLKCLRCGNEDETYFYDDNGVYYCRKCIMFGRVNVGEFPIKSNYKCKKHKVHYQLDYDLTKYQQNVVKEIRNHLKNQDSVLVYATTGGGKTEIVMGPIEDYLNAGKKVGIAISRRAVVLEIKERMQKAFPSIKVIAVCEGFTKVCDGDLIVCTMHQLYRYHEWFDLLVMDEVDAFPYRDNEVLEAIAMHSCVGQIIYLTATPDKKMLADVKIGKLKMVQLFVRPHHEPIVVPKIVRVPSIIQYVYMYVYLLKWIKQDIKVLLFVPTISMANNLHQLLRIRFACEAYTSKTILKDKIIQDFKKGKYLFLICTTILERGITIKGVNIMVLNADHIVFNEASLIQISGRVGRSIDCPSGEAIFLCKQRNEEMKRCVNAVMRMNEDL